MVTLDEANERLDELRASDPLEAFKYFLEVSELFKRAIDPLLIIVVIYLIAQNLPSLMKCTSRCSMRRARYASFRHSMWAIRTAS